MNMETITDRAILKGAVQQAIQCQMSSCGKVLDVRRAVHVEVNLTSSGMSTVTVDLDCWPVVQANMVAFDKDPLIKSVKIYDGRLLFGRRSDPARSLGAIIPTD